MPHFFPPEARFAAIAARLRSAGSVFAEDEARLLMASARSEDNLGAMISRRVAGEPIEYILGWAEFCGMRVAVEPGVFVPRRRTEFLVSRAVQRCKPGSVVVDLCCGSGAVGAAILAASPRIELYASDIDASAVRCAVRNLGTSAARVLHGDLFEPLPAELRGRVDLVVANAPYVPTASIALMPPEARLHEARVALDGGDDGLDVHRRIAADAVSWLAPGGAALVETSDRQSAVTADIFEQHSFRARIVHSPDLDATVVVAEL